MTKVTRLTINEGAGAQNRRIHLREISGDIDAPLETVGQDLRAARLRRGDDLATVSRVLKIRREHLEALEEDRLEALPGRTYAIGFVRSYAEYLGLDSSQHVERYKTEIAGRSDSVATVHVIDEDEDRHLPQGWVIMAGVVLVLLAYGAYHLIISANQLLSQPVTPAPPSATAVLKPVKREVTVQSSHARALPSEGAVTDASVQTADAGKPSGDAGASSKIFANGSPSGAGQAQNDSAPQVASLPRGQVYGAQNIEPRVVLRVHVPTRILVQGPEKAVLINRTMQPGDIYQVPNLVGLTLTTPNGGAVELDLDGAAMGFAGRNQQMTEALSLDPQAIVDRYNGGG
jgi:cytoskeleton protein RodZ